MNPKPVMNPKTVKIALKIAGVVLAVAGLVVAQWEAGLITDAAGLVQAVVSAVAGTLNEQP